MGQADVCTPDVHGMTALHHAAMRNRASVVGLLLRSDASSQLVGAVDRNDQTSLDLAVGCNAGAVVALLTFYGAQERGGRAKKLRGTAIRNRAFRVVQADDKEYGRTALHWAVWRGSLRTAKFLKGKVNVNAMDKDQLAAIHIAAMGGNTAMIRLLVTDLEADKEVKTGDGSTALHLATAKGNDSTVRLLVSEFGVDMEAKTEDGSTALHLAAANGNDSTVRLLVSELGADIEAKLGGSTALHLAAANGNASTVRLLVSDLGADKEAKTEDGSTAIHLAAAKGNDSTIRVLVSELGADKEAEIGDGSTALHQAAKFGHFSFVGMLIGALRANKNHKDRSGKTPLINALIWWWVSDNPNEGRSISNCELLLQ